MKKIIFSLIIILISCILFIRIVPDYSSKFGYKIVSLNDYKKYKQGYCLKEDRVLGKEEIFKRAVKNYFLVIKKDAENPKYWNGMQEEYYYSYRCSDGDSCFFYKFDFTNLDDYNKLMKTIYKISKTDFIEQYGKKTDIKNTKIFDENGNLKVSIGFNNRKYNYFYLYLPKSFEILSWDDMKKSNTLFENNPTRKIPSITNEYIRYYLRLKYIYTYDLMPNFINHYIKKDIYSTENDMLIIENIPITKCGDINIRDIYFQRFEHTPYSFDGV
ncbi:hypothetical protein [Campylobacter ureolyticus]|uniref:Lipoprotein n=2 Tax=Campylobacter ureolyticus TaxID=827 RepID=A0A9Q4KK15_9BACT|nr:hypothetical protein [Campylobacter ureolyticus]MCZ6158870.1 hypothetical protein [Campylobacter ureolyticus]MCZ6163051.1 hypothetical protein [Campylobacter ureolyticus]MCZ6164456.1 hypothetical protein [Campylobacter ureolyticus]MCZ6166316.1 hypothetical protein [Campylobacter ureolyticus]